MSRGKAVSAHGTTDTNVRESRMKTERLPLPEPLGRAGGWPWVAPEAGSGTAPGIPVDWPRIAVVIPSYNQAAFLEQAIRSVLLQNYPALELHVLDGGSQDGSVQIIRHYEPWLDSWESRPDGGQAAAINEGFRRSSAPIVHWLNSDDLLLPGALAHIAELQSANPDAAGWIGVCYRIDRRRRVLSTVVPRGLERDRIADWWLDGFFYQPSAFLSASVVREVGMLDEGLYGALDLDLWLRLVEKAPFVATDRALSAAVIHPDAKTQADALRVDVETGMVQLRYGYPDAALRRMEAAVRRASLPLRERLWGRLHDLLSRRPRLRDLLE